LSPGRKTVKSPKTKSEDPLPHDERTLVRRKSCETGKENIVEAEQQSRGPRIGTGGVHWEKGRAKERKEEKSKCRKGQSHLPWARQLGKTAKGTPTTALVAGKKKETGDKETRKKGTKNRRNAAPVSRL